MGFRRLMNLATMTRTSVERGGAPALRIRSALAGRGPAEVQMGQIERTMAVAGEFPRSWAAIRAAPGWWPGRFEAQCARLIREAGSVAAAVRSAELEDALCSSLVRWKAFRGVKLDRGRVRASLDAAAPLLPRWEGVSILRLRPGDVPELFHLFDALREIKPTTRKWVVTSKTLHHLLPDLVVPMDNLLTAPFLGMSSLPAAFSAQFLEQAYSAFGDLGGRSHGIGPKRVREAARDVPYPLPGYRTLDCRIGHARVIDFAIAGFVERHGGRALTDISRA
jgi:hypothetical protein